MGELLVRNKDRESYWLRVSIVLGLLFFIIYKFYLTGIAWHGRNSPLEPDDSYGYIAQVVKLEEGQNPFRSHDTRRTVLYNTWILILKNGLKIDFEQAFQLNFYIGSGLLGFVIYRFLSKSFKDPWFIPIGLIILSFYSGNGSYHGFYWVVPSFFAFIFWLLLVSEIVNVKNGKWIVLLSALMGLTHPLSVPLSMVLLVYGLLERQKSGEGKVIFNKAILVLLVVGVIQVLYFWADYHFGGPSLDYDTVYGGARIIKSNLVNLDEFRDSNIKGSLATIKTDYFDVVFPRIWLLPIFIGLFYIVLKEDDNMVALLYFSSILALSIFSFHPEGHRLLLVVWPMTFLLVARGVWIISNWPQMRYKLVWIFLIVGAIGTYGTFFNVKWAKSIAKKDNIEWDRGCVSWLDDRNMDKMLVFFDDKLSYNDFEAYDYSGSKKIVASTYNYLDELPIPGYAVLSDRDNWIEPLGQIIEVKDCGHFKTYEVSR